MIVKQISKKKDSDELPFSNSSDSKNTDSDELSDIDKIEKDSEYSEHVKKPHVLDDDDQVKSSEGEDKNNKNLKKDKKK